MIRGCADETWDLPSFGMVWQQLSDTIRIFGMNDDDDDDDDKEVTGSYLSTCLPASYLPL